MLGRGRTKQTLRYRLSEQKIFQSLRFVLKKYGIYKLSVTRICQKPFITDTTFYRHYHGLNDLFRQNQDNLLDQLEHFLAAEQTKNLSNKNSLPDC